jgi:hypothetical protein
VGPAVRAAAPAAQQHGGAEDAEHHRDGDDCHKERGGAEQRMVGHRLNLRLVAMQEAEHPTAETL